MIDFSGISNDSVLGRSLRLPLRLLPENLRVPVLQGPLKGASWVVGASTHGCWLGSFEAEKQELFADKLSEGDTVYDIGANVGFYSILAAKAVGVSGHVYAFEPLPRNLEYLSAHFEINELANFDVFCAALSDVSGWAKFHRHDSPSMGHLSPDGDLLVRTESLDVLRAEEKIEPPSVMKVDIEGAERAFLRGARETIDETMPLIFLATHGESIHRDCVRMLDEIGYECQPISEDLQDELICTPRT